MTNQQNKQTNCQFSSISDNDQPAEQTNQGEMWDYRRREMEINCFIVKLLPVIIIENLTNLTGHFSLMPNRIQESRVTMEKSPSIMLLDVKPLPLQSNNDTFSNPCKHFIIILFKVFSFRFSSHRLRDQQQI
jgi:hypothetical protein